MTRATDLIAQRKALLIVRCDLERMRLRLALQRAHVLLSPVEDGARPGMRWRWLLRAALLVGQSGRLGRVARLATAGLLLYRSVRSWRTKADRKA